MCTITARPRQKITLNLHSLAFMVTGQVWQLHVSSIQTPR